MTIALPILGTPDDINTYDGLIEAIVATLKDSTLEDQAPRFIYLAENYINRKLHNPDGENVVTATATARMALPADFRSVRSIYLDNDPRDLLTYMSPDDMRFFWPSQTTGKPRNYSLIAGELVLGPSPDDSYTVNLTYMGALTHLTTDNQQNWLIEKHADLYFYASLMHAEFFGWNDERIPLISNAVDAMIVDIQAEGIRAKYGSGLRMRPPVIERF